MERPRLERLLNSVGMMVFVNHFRDFADFHRTAGEVAAVLSEVPLLLRDLAENHTHWLAALEAITGARPVPASAAGKIPLMVDAWLGWAGSGRRE